jgi:hypothetical protein
MKNWIRNLILAIAIVFSFGNSNAQNSITIGNGNYNTWVSSNDACYGCGSFYVMIVNNPNQADGYYYYDIYFWSNSYYTTGYVANTYIKSVNIYMLNPSGLWNPVLSFPYVVVPPKSDYFNGYFYIGYIYSTSRMQSIKTTWSNISAW